MQWEHVSTIPLQTSAKRLHPVSRGRVVSAIPQTFPTPGIILVCGKAFSPLRLQVLTPAATPDTCKKALVWESGLSSEVSRGTVTPSPEPANKVDMASKTLLLLNRVNCFALYEVRRKNLSD